MIGGLVQVPGEKVHRDRWFSSLSSASFGLHVRSLFLPWAAVCPPVYARWNHTKLSESTNMINQFICMGNNFLIWLILDELKTELSDNTVSKWTSLFLVTQPSPAVTTWHQVQQVSDCPERTSPKVKDLIPKKSSHGLTSLRRQI